jgi:hypothetical protein
MAQDKAWTGTVNNVDPAPAPGRCRHPGGAPGAAEKQNILSAIFLGSKSLRCGITPTPKHLTVPEPLPPRNRDLGSKLFFRSPENTKFEGVSEWHRARGPLGGPPMDTLTWRANLLAFHPIN